MQNARLGSLQHFSQDVGELAKVFRAYYARLDRQGFAGLEPKASQRISGSLIEIIGMVESDRFALPDSWSELLVIYSQITWVLAELDYAYQVFEQHSDWSRFEKLGANFSSTFLHEAAIEMADLRTLYERFHTTWQATDFIPLFVDSIMRDAGSPVTTEFLDRLTVAFGLRGATESSMILYSAVLERALNGAKPDVISRGIRIIETLKTRSLEMPEPSGQTETEATTDIRRSSGIQWLVQTFRCVPTTPNLPLAEVMGLIGITGSGIKEAAEALTLRAGKATGLVLIDKTMRKPIEYDHWLLTDEDYLRERGLRYSPNLGVCQKILRRYQTIREVELIDEPRTEVAVRFFGHSAKIFYLLETLDGGQTYRFLSPYGKSDRTAVAVTVPIELIDGWRDPRTATSRRVQLYNQALSIAIIARQTRPFVIMESLEKGEVAREENFWHGVRRQISQAIIRDLISALPNREIISVAAFDGLFGDEFYTSVITHIAENAELGNPSQEDADLYLVEISLTFYRDLRVMQKKFRDAFVAGYQQKLSRIHAQLGDRRVASIKMRLSEILGDLLEESLAEVINRKNNFYLSLIRKAEMLRRTNESNR